MSNLVDAGRSSTGAAMPMWKVRDIQRRPSPNHEGFMTELVTNCGFRQVTVSPPQGGGQTELVGRK
jgi:hypothetical protein